VKDPNQPKERFVNFEWRGCWAGGKGQALGRKNGKEGIPQDQGRKKSLHWVERNGTRGASKTIGPAHSTKNFIPTF